MRCSWNELYTEVQNCEKCQLAAKRTNAVVGMGSVSSDLMFIGEGPGHDEDLQGLPFVGSAGKLLDKMLASIDITRDKVYIANIVKCRPPQNRVPSEEEATACLPYLRMQVGLVQPKIIVCLGATAVKYVLGSDIRITRDHGTWYQRKGTWIMPTYHPAALLYDETKKHDSWNDLKALKAKLNELSIEL